MRDSNSTKHYDIGDVVMVGVIIAVVCGLSLYITSFIYGLSIFDTLFLTLKIPIWLVLIFIFTVIPFYTLSFFNKNKKEHIISGIGKGYYFGINWEWSYLYYNDNYIPYVFKPICPKCQHEMCQISSSKDEYLQFKCSSCDDITSNVIHTNNNELDDFMGTVVSSSKKSETR